MYKLSTSIWTSSHSPLFYKSIILPCVLLHVCEQTWDEHCALNPYTPHKVAIAERNSADKSTISTLRDKPLFPAVVRSFDWRWLMHGCVVSEYELVHARNDHLLLGHRTPAPPHPPLILTTNTINKQSLPPTRISNTPTQPPTPARPEWKCSSTSSELTGRWCVWMLHR